MKNKYAVFQIGDKRGILTKLELIAAIEQAFREDKQKDYIFSFSFIEMTEDEAQHENAFYSTLKTEQ